MKNPLADVVDHEPVVQMCLDFLAFDAFHELANELSETSVEEVAKIVDLFREWEVVEAKEMMRVTEGRIKTIEKLQEIIDKNALEVPTLHNFLKEFPWVLDPRWNLIADEKRYSQLLLTAAEPPWGVRLASQARLRGGADVRVLQEIQ